METILDAIRTIRERPGVILGRPSASTLYAFLSGYASARRENNPDDDDFLSGFGQWVHDHYEITSTQNGGAVRQWPPP